jgi:hypothetical protein
MQMSDQVAGPKNRRCTAGTLREIFSRLPTAQMSEHGLRENVAQFARASRHSTGGTSGPRYGQRRYTVLQSALLKLSALRERWVGEAAERAMESSSLKPNAGGQEIEMSETSQVVQMHTTRK